MEFADTLRKASGGLPVNKKKFRKFPKIFEFFYIFFMNNKDWN